LGVGGWEENGKRLGEVNDELFQIVHGESDEDSADGSYSPLAKSINKVRIVNKVVRFKQGGTSHSTQSSDKSAATTTGADSNSGAPTPLASQNELKPQQTGSLTNQKNSRNKTLLKPCLKANNSYSHTYSDAFVQNNKRLGIAPDTSQKAEEFRKKRLRFHIPSSKQTVLSSVLTQTVWEPDATIPRFEFFNFNASYVCLYSFGRQGTKSRGGATPPRSTERACILLRIPADWSGSSPTSTPAPGSPYQSFNHSILIAENVGTECGRSS